MAERPDWDTYFMDLAHNVASRSTCPRGSIGAVLVHGTQIEATGYNGAPKGLQHCSEVGCYIKDIAGEDDKKTEHCVRTVHAEQNAVIQADDCAGATLYVTHQPCFRCAKMLINAGIERIVFDKEYQDADAIEFFEEAGVHLDVIDT